MPKKEPLYPHVPKNREPLFPHNNLAWRKGEQAICIESEDLSEVYIVEFTKDVRHVEVAIPVKIVDILSTTHEDIKVGSLFIAGASTLYRDFMEFSPDEPARLEWLKAQGISPKATAYNYRPWDTGDVAFYIDDSKNLVAGVQIMRMDGIFRVLIVKPIFGHLSAREYIDVEATDLYRSFRDFATQHPDKAEWLVSLAGPRE